MCVCVDVWIYVRSVCMCRSIFIMPHRYQYTEINLYKANNWTVYSINLSGMILQVHLHYGYSLRIVTVCEIIVIIFLDFKIPKKMGLYSGWNQTILFHHCENSCGVTKKSHGKCHFSDHSNNNTKILTFRFFFVPFWIIFSISFCFSVQRSIKSI